MNAPAPSAEDPSWPRASSWLAGSHPPGGAEATLTVLGLPLSQASISPSGAHETPAALRRTLRRYSTFAAPSGAGQPGVDLEDVAVRDAGDAPLADLDNEQAQVEAERAVRDLATLSPRAPHLFALLGGDNAITRPALRALAGGRLAGAGLLTLDAHHDVRGFHAGPTNGTPVRGLLEDGLEGRNVVQIGIGTFTNSRAHRGYVNDHGVTAIAVGEARAEGVGACVRRHLDALARRCDLVYVDLDVDVLDRAFAPACPGARPGGLLPSELFEAAHEAGRHPAVVAFDIVEVDATADPRGITLDVAAQCLLHAAAGLVVRCRDAA